ncbi:hypothetical protein [Nocardioides sp. CER19]|uniref:hypothetical protein n=1 Tax=Nocardioides sp. CER19 TaxID=3038538 RepID=UPI00244AF562|nr:hypothetical protein [Nocardioides sp. CER19]MDH2413346.1 hypothetical protein [Nocardioides sp. CER19]
MRCRRWLAGLAAVALVAAGCESGVDDGPTASTTRPASPRPVSAEQAQVLATTLFRNYDAGSRSLETTVAVDTQKVRLKGWIDYRTHTGYALATGVGFAPQLLRWNLRQVGLTPASTQTADTAPLPMPGVHWQTRSMAPSGSVLDTVLLVIAGLAQDRPENPLLLEQGGALWLGEDEVAGHELMGYAAPPSEKRAEGPVDSDASGLRLWVDKTGLARRVQIRTGEDWATVDLGDADGVSLPRLPGVKR